MEKNSTTWRKIEKQSKIKLKLKHYSINLFSQ